MLLGVPAPADADAHHAHLCVERDQGIGGAGIAFDRVGDGTGAEEIADLLAAFVEHQQAAPLGFIGFETGGLRKERAGFVELDRRVAIHAQPGVVAVDDEDDGDDDAEAIKAQRERSDAPSPGRCALRRRVVNDRERDRRVWRRRRRH